mgnify:CR=1 FL=1
MAASLAASFSSPRFIVDRTIQIGGSPLWGQLDRLAEVCQSFVHMARFYVRDTALMVGSRGI